MDITPEDVSLARSPVELPLSGLICNIRECQDSDNLCVLRLPSTSTVDQRLFEELDYFLRKAVPGSFLEHDTTHFAAANQAPSAGNTHDAQLIVRSLVSTDSPTGPTALSSPPPRIFGKRRRSSSHQENFPLVNASVEHFVKCLKHSSLLSSASLSSSTLDQQPRSQSSKCTLI